MAPETDETDENDAWPDAGTDGEMAPIDIDNPDVIDTARRRYGSGGAALAAGMFGLDIALGTKKKPESVQIQEAPTDPVDVDADGIRVTIDESMSVNAPPLERVPLVSSRKRRSRRR
jgi:hypothetical protein